ncbi:uncharacterized protein BcabD6B2_35450 [Babesia caballi]|uniref:Uncharacterized protein n=1 Tax=Babesia caballi TaxID=5871 RepID=A0AAV4LWW9_BABCB|nr:hypothetical protein, conserved [Babesia caballi]
MSFLYIARLVRLCTIIGLISHASSALAFGLRGRRDGLVTRSSRGARSDLFRTFNAPPKGSRIAKELEKFASDPLNTSPWEYEQPIVDSFSKEQSAGYRFLKNEWAYQDHSLDPNQPAGVLEGGRENYTGRGLKLERGSDRQRTERLPYHQDHGVYWRQRVRAGAVSFAISPDANQDVALDEDDLDLEARQWGSWTRPMFSYMPVQESAFRSRTRMENPTDLCYPWLTRHDVFERTPLHHVRAASFVPEPDPDMVLAAAGHFSGYMKRPFVLPSEKMRRQNQLLAEWDRLEAQYAKSPDKTTDDRIRSIKNALFSYDEMVNNDASYFTTAVDAAVELARRLMTAQRDDPAHNPDVIDYYLNKVPSPTAVGGGCSRYRGPGRTVALCLVGYFPDPKAFREYTSVEELAEAYHRFMTELRFEGSVHTTSQMVLDEDVREYLLRRDRRKFPSLTAEYAPLWAHRKFGPEFGDALKPGDCVEEADLTNFGANLNKRPRRKSSEERALNFADDYSSFSEEYC